ncbi:hypothetical protein [Lachnospira multipara]|uniref:hypothetical protein n=1 Tax=Lachnospira multipara TaxID=28051 RepID=UPI000487E527|nr:hypothetical protein [Lachnospira multipara]
MNNKRMILITAILFVTYNVVVFVIPSALSISFWVAYAFSVVSFGLLFFLWMDFFKKGRKIISKFYRIPILYVSCCYAFIQIVVSIVFKFMKGAPTWTAILTCAILLAATLIGLISIDGATEYVETLDSKIKPKVNYIKTLQVESELLLSSLKDENAKRAVGTLIEKIKYSDPMSDSSLSNLEERIKDGVESLKATEEKDIENNIDSILLLIEERNKKCKLLK